MFEFLDMPRQSLANFGRGVGRIATGQASSDDLLGMLPGAAGLAGLAMGASPILAALGAAGVQGMGKLSGSAAFDAPTTGDIVGSLGGDRDSAVQNIAAQILTDPLTFAGAAPGIRVATTPWRNASALEAEAAGLGKLAGQLDEATAARQAYLGGVAGPNEISQIANPLAQLDLPGIAAGDIMTRVPGRAHIASSAAPPVWATHPNSAAEMVGAGWGEYTPTGGLALYGRELPPGVEIRRLSQNGRMIGMGPTYPPGVMDVAGMTPADTQMILGPWGDINHPGVVPPQAFAGGIPGNLHLRPGERQYMAAMQQAGMAQPYGSVGPGQAIADDLAIERLAQQYAYDPTVSQLLPDMTAPARIPGLTGMGVRDARRALGSEIGAINANLSGQRLTERDLMAIMAAAAAGGYGGGVLGFQGY